ncbi:MAG TPA: DinB family protein [Gammaproteobacteria bacterium]
MQLAEAITCLSTLPDALAQRTQGLDEARLHFKPDAGVFSVLESVCHLRDIEAEGYTRRLELMLEEDLPLLPDLDGAALARARRYHQQSFATALQDFGTARHANLQTLRRLAPVDLERRGEYANLGVVTLDQVLDMWVAHDREHLQELDQLLAVLRNPAGAYTKPSQSLTQR